jgi:predicted Fe-Mo cluster-binding NifX family protein
MEKIIQHMITKLRTDKKLKIVLPTEDMDGLENNVSEHFGKCNTYTFVDENENVTTIINNIREHMVCIEMFPEIIKKHGADILLCRRIDQLALEIYRKFGIDVFVYQTETA